MRKAQILEMLFPEPRSSLLSATYLEPGRWWDQCALAERAGLQQWDLEIEIDHLIAASVLVDRRNGETREVRANTDCPFFAELQSIVSKSLDEPIRTGAILVVEDEPATLRIAKILLESWGYQVLQASTAREALDIFARQKESIRLVLTDLAMPEMNGVQLAERLAEIDGNARFVFMSGYHSEGLKQVGRWPLKFLPKPFSPERLARTIREALQTS